MNMSVDDIRGIM